jgi:glycosyl transferase family 1
MNILIVGNFGTGWDGSICDEEHIAKQLEELGHTVIRWQRDDPNTKPGGTMPWFDDNIKPDFTLIAQWDRYEDDFLKELPRPVVYWAFDHQEQNQEWHCRLIATADLYLSKRIEDKRFPNWQWLPQDFAPSFLKKREPKTPYDTDIKDIDVLFTGSYLDWATERNETIKAVGEKFNLVIHSVNSWPQGNEGPVMDKELPKLYARAKIVLSIDHTIERGYWSDRNAQAMACGAFVLCRYVPMMESTFKENIGYFYNVDDCLEKIGNLLSPDLTYIREEYAQKGYEFAQKNLKVYNRVNDLLTIVGEIL